MGAREVKYEESDDEDGEDAEMWKKWDSEEEKEFFTITDPVREDLSPDECDSCVCVPPALHILSSSPVLREVSYILVRTSQDL